MNTRCAAGARGAADDHTRATACRYPGPDRSATAPSFRPLAAGAGPLSWDRGMVSPETLLQPSPEQQALIAARRADPAGSLRVLAFAGAGKTTALKLLAEADP